MLETYLLDWLNLSLRFLHLVTGLAWIGTSFYFNWLENHLDRLTNNKENIAGNLWAIHGGGVYYLQKYKACPDEMPKSLYWFKWEAYATFLSGFALLTVTYYLNAETLLLAQDSGIEGWLGIVLSLVGIAVGWIIYDIFCRSQVVKIPALMVTLLLILATFFAFGYTHIFTPRAAFIQLGAIIGSIMVANVFFVIIPTQRKLVEACINKTPVSKELGHSGYIRSRHNNYFTLPVLFIMISGHYPMVYATHWNWLALIVIFILTALIRHYFNLKGEGKSGLATTLSLIVVISAALIFALSPNKPAKKMTEVHIDYEQIRPIVSKHCAVCHAVRPSSKLFQVAPAGLYLETKKQILLAKDKVYSQTIATQAMPLGNLTKMTEKERNLLGQWLLQQD